MKKSLLNGSAALMAVMTLTMGTFAQNNAVFQENGKSSNTFMNATENPKISLPFIGKARFNFSGGNGTGEYIVIKKNGETEIGMCGKRGCSASYTGKFKKIIEGYAFSPTAVSMVSKSGSIVKTCNEFGILTDEDHSCTQSLYFDSQNEPNTKKVNISQDVLDNYAYELLGGTYTTSNLAKKTNSKGVKIYCLSYKKVCKTEAEVIDYFNQKSNH